MYKTCFIICPIGDVGSEIRNSADLLFDFILDPVLGEDGMGLQLERADKLAEPGIITNQIIERLLQADLVVADLSMSNPNVFYELAIRHVTTKPCIHMIRRDDRLPFDNASARAIDFDLSDLRSVKSAKSELALQAEHALNVGRSESPVTISTSVQALRQTGDDTKVALGNILDKLTAMEGDIEGLRREVRTPVRSQLPGGMFGGPAATTSALGALGGPSSHSAIADALAGRTGATSESTKKVQAALDAAINGVMS